MRRKHVFSYTKTRHFSLCLSPVAFYFIRVIAVTFTNPLSDAHTYARIHAYLDLCRLSSNLTQ